MFKKWSKPSFLISAELHSKIARSCETIGETDSQVLEVRSVRQNLRHRNESRSVKNDFTYCLANH